MPLTLAHIRAAALLLTIALAPALLGCAQFTQPRLRAGSIPRPGVFTLYTVVDPADLGQHRYAGLDAPFVERTRGLIYTDRAGVIDVAHLRMTIDWNWYYYQRARHALLHRLADRADDDWLVLETSKPTRIRIQFDYDAIHGPDTAPLTEKQLDTLAFAIGQEIAWYVGIWHELAQWHGYRSTGVFSELDSAFTHDDTTSHLVGLYAAERAWRETRHLPRDAGDAFNDAITAAIDHTLVQFGARSPRETRRRIDHMRGRWWDRTGVLRRHVEPWTERGELRPWLAADTADAPGRWGEPMPLPDWRHATNVDTHHAVVIRIDPHLWETSSLLAAAGLDATPIDPRRHFTPMTESVRRDLLADFGPGADQP